MFYIITLLICPLLFYSTVTIADKLSYFYLLLQYMKLAASLSTSDKGLTIPYYALHGDIEFRNVKFSYPTRKDHVSCPPQS